MWYDWHNLACMVETTLWLYKPQIAHIAQQLQGLVHRTSYLYRTQEGSMREFSTLWSDPPEKKTYRTDRSVSQHCRTFPAALIMRMCSM